MARLFESYEQLQRDPLQHATTPLRGLVYALLSAFFLGVQTAEVAVKLKSHYYVQWSRLMEKEESPTQATPAWVGTRQQRFYSWQDGDGEHSGTNLTTPALSKFPAVQMPLT